MNVKAFDSAEEMFAAMQRDREAADGRIEDWQRTVKPGDLVLRIADVDPVRTEHVLIYGEIIDPVESEKAYYNLDDPVEAAEFEHVKSRYGDQWSRSFCFGRFYSPLCPEGEYGDIHRAVLTAVLTAEEFEAARGRWPQDPALISRAVVRTYSTHEANIMRDDLDRLRAEERNEDPS